MLKRFQTPLYLLPVALAASACGTSEPTELGSVHVKSETIVAAAGGTVEVTAADDYAPFVGTKVEIPAGALARDTKITVDVYSDSLMDDEAQAAGPAVELGPDGTQFSSPVRITLPFTEDLDEDHVRVYVRHGDGTTEVIMPEAITLDLDNRRLSFEVDHFTTFHPGRGRGPCSHVNCPSGQCRRGQCTGGGGACTAAECSPAPGAPNYTCPDGTIGGPVCERSASGVCGWNFVNCPTACNADSDCSSGEQCINGSCAVGSGVACGSNTCAAGEWCCNPSCGICAPAGGGCTEQFCGCSADADCASGERCVNGACVASGGGEVCGNNTCGAGQYCCNASCGMCAPLGVSCTQQACLPCGSDADCRSPAGGQGTCVNGYCM